MMPDRKDKDELDRAPAPPEPPRAPSAETLPTAEPGQRSITEQRRDLVRMIEELEGTLRYMGSGHPQRAGMQQRLQQLRAMLAQVR